MSRWFRRRQMWWPTPWGWLVLVALLGLAIAGLGAASPHILAPQSPARGARTLVVEGWLSRVELDEAAAQAQRGHYARVLTSGGPIEPWIDSGHWHDYATRAASYLQTRLPVSVPVTPVAAPATRRDRTYTSAIEIRDWARRSNMSLDPLDVYSAGVHARRSALLYRMALGDTAHVGVLSAAPDDYDIAHWWRSSSGVKAVMGETISLGWTICCFWPDSRESNAEAEAALRRPE